MSVSIPSPAVIKQRIDGNKINRELERENYKDIKRVTDRTWDKIEAERQKVTKEHMARDGYGLMEYQVN